MPHTEGWSDSWSGLTVVASAFGQFFGLIHIKKLSSILQFHIKLTSNLLFIAALRSRCGYHIFVLWFLLFLLFFPRLISAVTDWMSTILPHMCEFIMQVWNVLHTARQKHRTQKNAKNSPSAPYCTTLSGYILSNKATHRQLEKKLVKQQYLLQMSS